MSAKCLLQCNYSSFVTQKPHLRESIRYQSTNPVKDTSNNDTLIPHCSDRRLYHDRVSHFQSWVPYITIPTGQRIATLPSGLQIWWTLRRSNPHPAWHSPVIMQHFKKKAYLVLELSSMALHRSSLVVVSGVFTFLSSEEL